MRKFVLAFLIFISSISSACYAYYQPSCSFTLSNLTWSYSAFLDDIISSVNVTCNGGIIPCGDLLMLTTIWDSTRTNVIDQSCDSIMFNCGSSNTLYDNFVRWGFSHGSGRYYCSVGVWKGSCDNPSNTSLAFAGGFFNVP